MRALYTYYTHLTKNFHLPEAAHTRRTEDYLPWSRSSWLYPFSESEIEATRVPASSQWLGSRVQCQSAEATYLSESTAPKREIHIRRHISGGPRLDQQPHQLW